MDTVLHESVEKLHTMFDRTDLEVEWKKIQQKLEEARYSPGDVKPLAGCVYAILLAARSRGFSVEAVLKELDKIAEENLHRRWKKMPDGTHQAI